MLHVPSISLKTESSSWHSHTSILWVRGGWRDKLIHGDILIWTEVVSLHPAKQYSLLLSGSLQFPLFWDLYLLLSVFLKLAGFFLSHISGPDTGCCLLTHPDSQHPKHVFTPRMSGSLERSDNCAVPINFLASEAQKQHQQKTFSSGAVRKTCQASRAGEGRGSSAGTEGGKGSSRGKVL